MRAFVLGAVISAAVAQAGPRTLAVSAGACRDIDLVQAQSVFAQVLAERLGDDAVEPRALLATARPASPAALDELQRLFEAGKGRFYAGQHEQALAQLKQAIEGLERAPPSARSWQLLGAARVQLGLALLAVGKKEPGREAFRRVLRVDPGWSLDPDDYSPSTIAVFEATRAELKGGARASLTVRSQPAGAELFIDGAPAGKTPLSTALPRGSYGLTLTLGTQVSFTRTVKLDRDTALQVDLGFESRLSPQLPLCLDAAGDEAVADALKLGAFAQVDQVVLLRVGARDLPADWLEAALLDVGRATRVRAGGMKLLASRRSGALDELAAYVLTGREAGNVVAASESPGQAARPGAEAGSPRIGVPASVAPPAGGALSEAGTSDAVSSKAPDPVAPAASDARAASAASEVSASPRRGPGARIAGVVLLAAGLATGAASGAVYAVGLSDRDRLAALLDPQGQLPPPNQPGRAEAEALQPRVSGNTAATVALAATAGALALTGAALLLFLPPQDVQVGLAPGPEGAALVLSGRF